MATLRDCPFHPWDPDKGEQARPCVRSEGRYWFVTCPLCEARGPISREYDYATIYWNRTQAE